MTGKKLTLEKSTRVMLGTAALVDQLSISYSGSMPSMRFNRSFLDEFDFAQNSIVGAQP